MSKQDGNTTVFAKTLAKVYDRYLKPQGNFVISLKSLLTL